MKKMLMLATVPSMIGQFNMPNIHILKQLGYEVHVVCNFKDTTIWNKEQNKSLLEKLELNNVFCHDVCISRSPFNVVNNFSSYFKICEILRNDHYEFIHCHTPVGGAIGRLTGKKTKTKVIYTAHGFHFYKGASFINWMFFYPIEFWLSRYTNILITINKEDYLLSKTHFKAKQTVYVPGVGIEYKKFNSQNEKCINEIINEEKKVEENTKILISVGELSKRKNHLTAINAIDIIKQKAPELDFKYYIVGLGVLETQIKHEIMRRALSGNITLLGYRTDIAELLQKTDIYVFPSIQEGLPVALIEAMASGLPVVCSNIRGNTDLIADGKGGLLVSPKDENEYAEKMIELMKNKEKRRLFGAYNKKKAQYYAIENIELKMREIYQELN